MILTRIINFINGWLSAILGAMISLSFCTPLLFLASGLLAGWKPLLRTAPESMRRALSFYLVGAIGLKGGLSMGIGAENSQFFWVLSAAGLSLGFLQPFLGYGLLRWGAKIDAVNAAAVSAHYGSISLMTFAAAASFLDGMGIEYHGAITAVMALMELPAIASGLFLAKWLGKSTADISFKKILKDLAGNKIVLMLLGGLLIGWLLELAHLRGAANFVLLPFPFVLCAFLFDMGMTMAAQKRNLRSFRLSLGAFGIYMPLIGSLIGIGISKFLGLDFGTGLLFAVLAASASYIAVPAVMRMCLPEADERIYFPLSIGITFPFNVTLGIPIYHQLAKLFL